MVLGYLSHQVQIFLRHPDLCCSNSVIMLANLQTALNPVMLPCCGERDKSLFNSSQHCISMFTLLSKKCTINMISGNFLINTGLYFC